MRRALVTLALLLAWPAAADAASVKVDGCVAALDPVARSATFEARVRAARGSDRMQVRFTLQVRDDALGARWRKLAAPGFDQWLTSAAGVRRYSYARTIQNLSAPASYRTIVRFRWLDRDGEVLKSARRTSAACRQPDMRPDVAPVALEVRSGDDPATRRYLMTVSNAGRTAAPAFAMQLPGIDDGELPALVPGLAPGERRTVTFTGPACKAGAAISVVADPGDVVDERDEDDNVLVATCPTGAP